jgi:hypothetical protein
MTSSNLGPLYHWSPRDRHNGIIRLGLVPGKKKHWYANNVTGKREAYIQDSVSFSLDPATAWNYSHGCWRSVGEFDLWQTYLIATDEVHILPMWGSTVTEVRVKNRIPKRRLIWIGERVVTE